MLVGALLVACSGDEAAERTPGEAMTAASQAVLSAPSFSFQVSYVGDPVEVQAGLALDRVDGVFEAPTRSSADVRVKTLGLTAILEVVTEGDRLWQKVPFAEDFEEVEDRSDAMAPGAVGRKVSDARRAWGWILRA